ncbi:MAG: nicotinate-nucleotide adenylyltransferase [Bryobacteraceae bacterium]
MGIGLYGGTFDPVHDAHLAIAREALARCGLERVLLIPASRPPHKRGLAHASYEHRYQMVELACAGDPRLEASRLEAGARQSYSIDTIERVRTALGPTAKLFWIIGADAFAEIRTWRRWRDVAAQVEFIVVSRPGHAYDLPAGARVHRLDTLALPVSSSEVRRRLARGCFDVPVPAAVLAYIREHALYR